jgi:hypothetical protein
MLPPARIDQKDCARRAHVVERVGGCTKRSSLMNQCTRCHGFSSIVVAGEQLIELLRLIAGEADRHAAAVCCDLARTRSAAIVASAAGSATVSRGGVVRRHCLSEFALASTVARQSRWFPPALRCRPCRPSVPRRPPFQASRNAAFQPASTLSAR